MCGHLKCFLIGKCLVEDDHLCLAAAADQDASAHFSDLMLAERMMIDPIAQKRYEEVKKIRWIDH